MANSNIVPTAIVRELLEKDNYDHWRVQVKTYLVAQDLWDVVEAPIPSEAETEAYKAWYKRNAAALHAIQISCSSDTFNGIIKIRLAKEAWDTLENLINNDPAKEGQKEENVGEIVEEGQKEKNVGETVEEGQKEENVGETVEEGQKEENVGEIVEEGQKEENVGETVEEGQREENAGETVEEGQKEENAGETVEEGQKEENVGETVEGQKEENVGEIVGNEKNVEYRQFFNKMGKRDWTGVKEFIGHNPEAVRVTSPTSKRTALHMAVTFGHLQIVEELVNLMTPQPQDLEIKEDVLGETAFHIAVKKGNISMAKCMAEKNYNLLSIATSANRIPIVIAVVYGQKQMVDYLYPLTVQQGVLLSDDRMHGADLMIECIYSKMFGIVFDLIKQEPLLLISRTSMDTTPVAQLVHVSALFPSKCQLKFWQWWIYNCMHVQFPQAINDVCLNIQNAEDNTSNKQNITIKFAWSGLLQWMASNFLKLPGIDHIYESKMVHIQSTELLNRTCKVIETLDEKQIKDAEIKSALVEAASQGIIEYVKNITKAIPKTMWTVDFASGIFESAIRNREAKVFSLIHGLDDKQSIVNFANSNNEGLLHVTGHIANPRKLNLIAGVALQMQREMQWYKEVEAITPEGTRMYFNEDDKRAREVFTENHKDLMIAGETWMKSTSSSCTVVGALIFTIMFTAAFTLPGGQKQDTGFPIFLDKKLFKLFIISDAISLFSSTTSVLTFLGILTSRYAEEDFLTSLPKKMMLGLSTLFISIAAMMTAFCAVIALLFQSQLWIVVPTILLAITPVILFVMLQFPLLVEIFVSTYGRSIFDRNVGNWLA